MDLWDKLSLLAASARYDASCSSSGGGRREGARGMGSTVPGGICHTFTEDGRCVSLLKILFTNHCIYDCAYCANRASNDIPRAAFTTRELTELTLHFYQRNYIEGLFLSSGIFGSPDTTLARLIEVVKGLRKVHGFRGYIHLKCIPGASERLVQEAGLYADRLSVNIEIPTDENLQRLAAQKNHGSALAPMDAIREGIVENRDERRRFRSAPLFAPAGQSTQLVVGASPEPDLVILNLAHRLYTTRGLRRVYYSAYVSVNPEDSRLPALHEPPLRRENRLYQADWLLRYYGYSVDDLLDDSAPFLDLAVDPKMKYARAHPELFPVDVNRADRETLLRVPGIGLKGVETILQKRRQGTLRYEHLQPMGLVLKRAGEFIACPGKPDRVRVPAGGGQGRARSAWLPTGGPGGHATSLSAPGSGPTVIYDGTFAGVLSLVFDLFAREMSPARILVEGKGVQIGLFEAPLRLETDEEKASRAWRRFGELFGETGRRHLYRAFLSGDAAAAELIYHAVAQLVETRRGNVVPPSASPPVWERIESLSSRVAREAHRMQGLVRFEELAAGACAATIQPRYDVLPLIGPHFQERFAHQHWVIYDTGRDYGLHFDTAKTRPVRLDWRAFRGAHPSAAEEEIFQQLWKIYFDSLTIPDRRNPDLHIRMLPRRYWPYLPEKRPPRRDRPGGVTP